MMEVLGHPFKLFGRLIVAAFKITGYIVTFIIQAACYSALLKRDKIVDALGVLGQSVTNAIGDVFND
jgi:hypothetical protein